MGKTYTKEQQLKFSRIRELIIKGEKEPLSSTEWDELNALIDELKAEQIKQSKKKNLQ